MAATQDCAPCCTTTPPVQVPGGQGLGGVTGLNAFTTTAAPFTVPAINAQVTVQFVAGQAVWMVPGQMLVIGAAGNGPETFTVISLPNSSSAVLQFLSFAGDGPPGTVINTGAMVSPGLATNGFNAYTTAVGNFGVPQVGGLVTATVVRSAFFAIGQNVVAGGPGSGPATFKVISIPMSNQVQLQFLGYPGDVAVNATILSGAVISPSGVLAGADTVSFFGSGAAFPVPANATPQVIAIGAVNTQIIITKPGTYLFLARVHFDYNGATTPAAPTSRSVTTRLQRTNNGPATFGQFVFKPRQGVTTIIETASISTFDPVIYTTPPGAFNDTFQLQAAIDVVLSAGTVDCVEASIVAVRIA